MKNTFKKLPASILSVITVLSLCSCSITEGGTSVPELTSEQISSSEQVSSDDVSVAEPSNELTESEKQMQELMMKSKALFTTLDIENNDNSLDIYATSSYTESSDSKLLSDALSVSSGFVFAEKDNNDNVINPIVRMTRCDFIDTHQTDFIPMKYYYEAYKNTATGEIYEYYLKFSKDEDIPKVYRYDLLTKDEKAALGEVITPVFSESVIIEGDGGVSIPEEGEFVPQLPPDYAVTDFDKLILSFDPYIAYDVSTLEKNGEQYILGNVVLCDTDKLNVIPQNINSIDNAADFDKKGRYWGDIQMNADSEISDNAITVKVGDKVGKLTVTDCYSLYNSGIKGFMTAPETETYYNVGAEKEGYSISFSGEVTLEGYAELSANGLYFYCSGKSLSDEFTAVPFDYVTDVLHSTFSTSENKRFTFAYRGLPIYITADELSDFGYDIENLKNNTSLQLSLTLKDPEMYYNKHQGNSFSGKITALQVIKEIK